MSIEEYRQERDLQNSTKSQLSSEIFTFDATKEIELVSRSKENFGGELRIKSDGSLSLSD